MKKLFIVVLSLLALAFIGCDASMQFEQEAYDAKYKSTYATTINKLEMSEGNFETYRRVIFYNVRLGETVFSCEGFCHVSIDKDGDVELVVKVGEHEYLRHYLGQKQDITYFSEQLESSVVPQDRRYRITFNPRLWMPEFKVQR